MSVRGTLAAVALFAACSPTQATPGDASPARPSAVAPDAPEPSTHYLGRQKAPTMGHLGADWLLREEREAEENVSAMVDALGLEPGQTACDVGAGVGVHALRMAQRVAPGGRVLAVDIQTEMLEMLQARAQEAGATNIETVLGTQTDSNLPADTCSVILLVDVYHEFDDPEAMLASMRRALSADGRIALVEFRAEDPNIPIKELHKMSRAQILKEFSANRLHLVGSYDDLPWQHLMFFGRKER